MQQPTLFQNSEQAANKWLTTSVAFSKTSEQIAEPLREANKLVKEGQAHLKNIMAAKKKLEEELKQANSVIESDIL